MPAESDKPIRSAEALAKTLIERLKDPAEAQKLAASPDGVRDLVPGAVAAANASQLRADRASNLSIDFKIYNIVVWALGASVVLVVLAISTISIVQLISFAALKADPPGSLTYMITIPDGLIALGSAAVGALAGLLTPLSARS
jgi:hypothetical protein